MATQIIRAGEPTFADLCDGVRRAKVAHGAACQRFKEAQKAMDGTYDVLAKAQRALGEFCDRATDPA